MFFFHLHASTLSSPRRCGKCCATHTAASQSILQRCVASLGSKTHRNILPRKMSAKWGDVFKMSLQRGIWTRSWATACKETISCSSWATCKSCSGILETTTELCQRLPRLCFERQKSKNPCDSLNKAQLCKISETSLRIAQHLFASKTQTDAKAHTEAPNVAVALEAWGPA